MIAWIMYPSILIFFVALCFGIMWFQETIPYLGWLILLFIIGYGIYRIGKDNGKKELLDKLKQRVGRFPYDRKASDPVDDVVGLVEEESGTSL